MLDVQDLKKLPSVLVCSLIPRDEDPKARFKSIKKKIPKRVGASAHPCFTPLLISITIFSLDKLKLFGPDRCPVYICLRYLGSVASFLEDKVKNIVETTYDAVKLKITHLIKKPLKGTFKDVTPFQENRNVIYHFK